jgi:hypothetical protein
LFLYEPDFLIFTHCFYLLPDECPPDECPPDECPPDECPPDECPPDDLPPEDPDDLDELCDEMLLDPDPELNDLEDDECA